MITSRPTFFRALRSNLKCAFCREKDCTLRYYPERKKYKFYDGVRYVLSCKKDQKKRIKKILKDPFP